MLLTLENFREILDDVVYKDWTIKVVEEADGRCWLQVQFLEDDFWGDRILLQSGRKWLLSEHMTKSEVVQTALKAVLAAEEHEARERFTYKGANIYGPHMDVEALLEIHGQHDVRTPVVTT